MDERPIDLRPLDPRVDSASEDVFVAGVLARISSRRERLGAGDVLAAAWTLSAPAMIAAGILLATLVYRGRLVPVTQSRPSTVAQAIGVPPQFFVAGPNEPGERPVP